jgi:hypothetical protein
MNHLEVVLVAHGPFDEADIDPFGIFLHIHDRAKHEVNLAGQLDEELVEVQERHVTAGTAA